MKRLLVLFVLLVAASELLLSKPPRKTLPGQSNNTKAAVSEYGGRREPAVQCAGGTYASTLSNQRILVLMVQFQDVQFAFSHGKFEELLSGERSSVKAYLQEQFSMTRDFVFDLSDPLTAANPLAWYGGNDSEGNDSRPRELVSEACSLADSSVDFSDYDADGDGVVDLVAIFVAGKDEADSGIEDCLWSHSWEISSSGLKNTFDGVKVDNYILTTELTSLRDGTFGMATIGAFCHEFSHYLGLTDLYDTDYDLSGGKSVGVWGHTSIMDSGCYNDDGRTPPPYNAVELDRLGAGECLMAKQGSMTLPPIVTAHSFIKVGTGLDNVYYLLEYRSSESWDKYSGGTGMLVYRVDKSNAQAGYSTGFERNLTAAQRWEENEVNCNPSYMCARILEAEKPDVSYEEARWSGQIQSIFYPGPSGKYSSLILEGTSFSLSGIEKKSGYMSFSVNGLVSYDGTDVFQESAILNWHLDTETESQVPVRAVIDSDGRKREYDVLPYSAGKYALSVDGLENGTEYGFTLCLPDFYGQGTEYTGSFETLPRNGNSPYIYLKTADRYISGAFRQGSRIPLKLFNLVDASYVEWFMDGEPIVTDETGYYSIVSSGELMALVHYLDGSEEKIVKNVTVK